MERTIGLRRIRPWRNALMATTGLAVFFILASSLWQSGYPEWAFLLFFLAVWVLISISWSNIDFTEQSGTILARIVDKNFLQMHSRIEQLEEEIFQLKGLLPAAEREAANRQLRD